MTTKFCSGQKLLSLRKAADLSADRSSTDRHNLQLLYGEIERGEKWPSLQVPCALLPRRWMCTLPGSSSLIPTVRPQDPKKAVESILSAMEDPRQLSSNSAILLVFFDS